MVNKFTLIKTWDTIRMPFDWVSQNRKQSNHNGQSEQRLMSQGTNQSSKQINLTGLKRAKTRVTKSRLVFVLHLIGWEGGVSFLDQSQLFH